MRHDKQINGILATRHLEFTRKTTCYKLWRLATLESVATRTATLVFSRRSVARVMKSWIQYCDSQVLIKSAIKRYSTSLLSRMILHWKSFLYISRSTRNFKKKRRIVLLEKVFHSWKQNMLFYINFRVSTLFRHTSFYLESVDGCEIPQRSNVSGLFYNVEAIRRTSKDIQWHAIATILQLDIKAMVSKI